MRHSLGVHVLPILERLDVDLERWLAAMTNGGRFGGSAIGCAWARAKESKIQVKSTHKSNKSKDRHFTHTPPRHPPIQVLHRVNTDLIFMT